MHLCFVQRGAIQGGQGVGGDCGGFAEARIWDEKIGLINPQSSVT